MSELLLGLGIGILTMLSLGSIVFIRLRSIFDPKKMLKSLNASKAAELSVQARIDKGFVKSIVQDLTSPDNPIGFVMSLFPTATEYITENPHSIQGAIQLLNSVANIPNLMVGLQGIAQNRGLGLNQGNGKTKYLNNPNRVEIVG
jgi:hypothetical protein